MKRFKFELLGVNILIDLGWFLMFGIGYTNEEIHLGIGPIIISFK